MIKTWPIPIVFSIMITIALLTVNFMVFISSNILANYLRQKGKVVLVDSFIKDVFENVEIIADGSIYSSGGNSSAFKEDLERGMTEFMNDVLASKDFFYKCGIAIDFKYEVNFYNYTEAFVAEIYIKAYAKDFEGLFSLERDKALKRMLQRF
ncbi:MAG: hypothetical protein ACUVQY_06995 [Thermoproteota archaeon]